jgi:hypothetical protein
MCAARYRQDRVLPPEQLVFDFARPDETARSMAPARPNAVLVLFPLSRRPPLISKIIRQVAAASSFAGAENLLLGHLARVGRTLLRKRVPEEVVRREIVSLEAAVRAGLRRVCLEGER